MDEMSPDMFIMAPDRVFYACRVYRDDVPGKYDIVFGG
jgi:hypothetical protein